MIYLTFSESRASRSSTSFSNVSIFDLSFSLISSELDFYKVTKLHVNCGCILTSQCFFDVDKFESKFCFQVKMKNMNNQANEKQTKNINENIR